MDKKLDDKKIAIIYNTSWYVYNFRVNLIKHLQTFGAKIIVLAPRDNFTEKLIQLGCEFQEIYVKGNGMNPFQDLYTLYTIKKALKLVKPDICLQYTIKPNIYGSIACLSKKIPVINNVAGLGSLFEKKNIMTIFALNLYKFAFKKASHIFFQNNDDLSLFKTHNIISNNYSRIPGSGVDLERFKDFEEFQEKKSFLLFSRLLKSKGVEEYLKAAEILKKDYPDYSFKLLGHFEKNNNQYIDESILNKFVSNGTIEYLGETDNVVPFIKDSGCIVLPSYYREGVPRSLLESAAMSKAIITTDHIGCRDAVIDGFNGYLCEVENYKDLADKMRKYIILSIEEKKSFGRNSRLFVEKYFDEKIVLDNYYSTILKLLRIR
ncbi:MAG: glycosyltransferase family 4 protein [Candidatus Delongbacteria bacterium]|nr:glycosyltransferase family 4 protein [Candidatus Delongbacteria bacterium]MBN2836847.1 glycosyltransferase family 4 protein [Candidatus Delongbacteria bacterium]